MKARWVPVLMLIVAGSPGFSQHVKVDYDTASDFSKYRTYAWREGTPAPTPMGHQRIVNAIERQLAAKGIAKVEQEPDVYVIYHAGTKEELQVTDWGHGGPRWGWSRNIDVRKVLVGTVVLDIVDAKDGKLFWRGIASDTVGDKPEQNEKKINKAAEKMFKKFPAGKEER